MPNDYIIGPGDELQIKFGARWKRTCGSLWTVLAKSTFHRLDKWLSLVPTTEI